MSYQTEINVIMQGGCMVCPLCHNQKKWRFKRDFVHYPFQNGMAVVDDPHGIKDFIISADNKVRFLIFCDTCKVTVETDSMEFVNKENYEKYKEE